MKSIDLGKIKIGQGFPPFIIAEMSGNHNQSLDRALELVDAAAEAGVHALKLQTYTQDTITLDSDLDNFIIKDNNSPWFNRRLYDLYKEAHTPWEWHEPIFNRAKEKGMIAFSSVFDISSVDFLEKLGCPIYKISSFENTHLPLLRKVGSTGKPVIMSTGASSITDIYEGVRELREAGCPTIVLLKCTSAYPAPAHSANILTIPHMAATFDCLTGLSDHSMGIGVAIAAIAQGAVVIEKHFTIRRSDGGPDSSFSMEPEEMKSLVIEGERAFQSLGRIFYGHSKAEEGGRLYKQSIFVSKNIKKGETFELANTRIVRPADGLEPKYLDFILGKKACKDIKAGTPVTWDLLLS